MKRFFLAGVMFILGLGFSRIALAQESQENKKITVEELTKTKASQLFKLGDYDAALLEFQKLSQDYPQDSLPLRYTGMTLILLGRLDEAISTLENAVNLDSSNPANHYFLARALHEQGNRTRAESELQEVIRLDTEQGFYGAPAKNALRIVRERGRFKVSKPWEVVGSVGYEYDTNVTLAPNDKSLRSPGDNSAGRYYANLGGSYRFYQKGNFSSRAGYRVFQSLHDDSLNEFNFTFQEFSLLNEYRTKQFGKEVTYGFRYALPWGFLNGVPFSIGNQITLSITTRLTKRSRTELFYRYEHTEFRNEGIRPNLTSRDGEYNTIGLSHRYYFSNFSRWVFASYLMEPFGTEGNNFDRFGESFQAGFHTPLLGGRFLLDFFGQLTVATYPHFSTELVPREPHRLDNDWTLVVRLTYPLNTYWSLRGSYRYVNANNKNDLFQYDRQVGGVELLFRY